MPGTPPPNNSSNGPDLYKVLGLQRTATAIEIKKAYRVLALKYHPDKSTKAEDSERFKDINSAYEILIDPERKRTYDQFGVTSDDAPHQQQSHHGMPDIFSQMFNFQNRSASSERRGNDTTHYLEMTLEDLYTGKTFRLNVSREQVCVKCSGKGGLIMKSCPGCAGTGRQTTMRAIAPGFMQRVDTECGICKGSAEIAQDKCTDCGGAKTKGVVQPVEFRIPPGSHNGDRHVHGGLGNAAPGVSAGDVIFVVKEMPHEIFTRKAHDLLINVKLSLRQSLCGFSVDIRHVDGKTISLHSNQGRITKPDSESIIKGKGITQSGSLVVIYKVEFPETIKECADIAESLPALIAVQS